MIVKNKTQKTVGSTVTPLKYYEYTVLKKLKMIIVLIRTLVTILTI